MVLAAAWPSPKLQRGTAALSASLHDSLGRPAAATLLLLYRAVDVACAAGNLLYETPPPPFSLCSCVSYRSDGSTAEGFNCFDTALILAPTAIYHASYSMFQVAILLYQVKAEK